MESGNKGWIRVGKVLWFLVHVCLCRVLRTLTGAAGCVGVIVSHSCLRGTASSCPTDRVDLRVCAQAHAHIGAPP